MMKTTHRKALASYADRLQWVTENRETGNDALGDVAKVRADLDEWLRMIVGEARVGGATWAELGEALGISRQAAQQRFGR